VAVFALVHGGAGTAALWDGVADDLARLGHEAIAMDLPADDPEAGWEDYARAVESAVEDRKPGGEVIVVSHSLGGFVAPLVCGRVAVENIVLVFAMIPAPGETFGQWWQNTGHTREVAPDWTDPETLYNGVPRELAERDARLGEGRMNVPDVPRPLAGWPEVPTRFLLAREDRVFPRDFMRRGARERVGIEADEMDGGHGVPLSHPEEMAEKLDCYAKERRWER
jgi:pimeloyl-ACP methyl ester carboxylesterase